MKTRLSLQSLNTLVRYATDQIEMRPPLVQAEIYSALSDILPLPEDRTAAARLAFSIRETCALQMEFTRLIAAATETPPKDPQ